MLAFKTLICHKEIYWRCNFAPKVCANVHRRSLWTGRQILGHRARHVAIEDEAADADGGRAGLDAVDQSGVRFHPQQIVLLSTCGRANWPDRARARTSSRSSDAAGSYDQRPGLKKAKPPSKRSRPSLNWVMQMPGNSLGGLYQVAATSPFCGAPCPASAGQACQRPAPSCRCSRPARPQWQASLPLSSFCCACAVPYRVILPNSNLRPGRPATQAPSAHKEI